MRRFRDDDGVEWEAKAIPSAPVRQPGQATPTMDEVAWQVRFIAHDPGGGRLAIVPPELGQRFDELSEAELRALLADAS